MCPPTGHEVETEKEKAYKEKRRKMLLLYEELSSAAGVVAITDIKETAASFSQPSLEGELGIYPF